jgi:peptidoglycan/xylan/chitin deacetylase (PgdA/CDA1 family)
MNKRELLADALHRAGVLRAVWSARSRLRSPWLTVLTYHRVARLDADSNMDAGVVDATPEQFDAQMSTLAEHFQFIGIPELVAFTEGVPLPPNPVIVTFDDGYLDCYTTALPILRRYGGRAVFFIATAYTEERCAFWWDRISYTLKRTERQQITLTRPREILLDLSGDRDRAIRRVLDLVKTEYALDLDELLDELSYQAGVPWDREEERRMVDQTLMTWDHLRELKGLGMDVESHSRTHRVLQTLPDEALARELRGSKRELEAKLGAAVHTIAYPVGYPIGGEARIRRALDDAGYRLGFTNATGVTPTRGRPLDRFDVRRLAMDLDISEAFFRTFVAIPPLARKRELTA